MGRMKLRLCAVSSKLEDNFSDNNAMLSRQPGRYLGINQHDEARRSASERVEEEAVNL